MRYRLTCKEDGASIMVDGHVIHYIQQHNYTAHMALMKGFDIEPVEEEVSE